MSRKGIQWLLARADRGAVQSVPVARLDELLDGLHVQDLRVGDSDEERAGEGEARHVGVREGP